MRENKVLIYAGTTEGRMLAEYLARKQVRVHVCVATAYGESLLSKEGAVTVTHNRMNKEEMVQFIEEYEPVYVIDATHPYAREVTRNLKAACEKCGAPYLRLVREQAQVQDCVYVKDVNEAVKFLEKTEGNIMVTTGSKELEAYTALADYQERIYARVLSVGEVAAKCERLGFAGRHLICMQGPFSVEMNLAMLKEFQIDYLVTKESGTAGGYPEKCEAAAMAGTRLLVIGRPVQEEGYTYEEVCRFLLERLHLSGRWKVTLTGTGTGSEDVFTIQGRRACQEAQLLIGAPRMLKMAAIKGQRTYTAYKPEEIVRYIKEHPEYEKVTVALSGDTGFYSGARRLMECLDHESEIDVKVLPGISSVVYLSAKMGVSWEDAALVSMHGRRENLISVIRGNKKIFVLAGTAESVRGICREMTEYGYGNLAVTVGADLSYDTELILSGTARELAEYEGADLAVLYVENPQGGNYMVVPGIPDDEFIRGDVPMTKEEVRSVSISKLHIKKDSIVYDVGAGTGSIAIEAALQTEQGHVYAIERNETAAELIRENQKAFKADNLTVIMGEAPEVTADLPAPDCVFIGGSKGRLREIIDQAARKNPGVRIVVNAITLETLTEVLECTKVLKEEYRIQDEEIVQITVSKARHAGGYHMMNGQNPIFIISLQFSTMPMKRV